MADQASLPAWAAPLAEVASGLEIAFREPLSRRTTLKVGGPAELLVTVETSAALAAALVCASRASVPFEVIGLGSNLLVPDEGLPGIVCRLAGDFLSWEVEGTTLRAGAGVALPRLSRAMAAEGLLGLEALSGFPSTVGGAVCMNAGCYGTEIKDVLLSVDCVERDGTERRFRTAEIEPAYRSTRLQDMSVIVVSATFGLRRGDAGVAMKRIEELNRKRWQALPSGRPTAGSVFKNPEGDYAGRLIEACGLRGRAQGGAAISEEHANVITNEGGATAEDVLELMVLAHRRVFDEFGVDLAPELVLTGDLRARWRARTAR